MQSTIIVPASMKHMLRPERQTTEDYKAQIMHYISARPNKALTNKDFNALLGTTSAMSHIKRLMRQGHITRVQIRGGRGKRFAYKWHEVALPFEKAARQNGDVIVTNLKLPEFGLTPDNLKVLALLFLQWLDTQQPDGTAITGARDFRLWLDKVQKEVEAERKRLIDGHNNNNRSNSADSSI
jgi:hypothetical protein